MGVWRYAPRKKKRRVWRMVLQTPTVRYPSYMYLQTEPPPLLPQRILPTPQQSDQPSATISSLAVCNRSSVPPIPCYAHAMPSHALPRPPSLHPSGLVSSRLDHPAVPIHEVTIIHPVAPSTPSSFFRFITPYPEHCSGKGLP